MKKTNLKAIVSILVALLLVGASAVSAHPGPHGHGRPPPPHYHHHYHGGGGDDLLAGACLGAFGALALISICSSEQEPFAQNGSFPRHQSVLSDQTVRVRHHLST